MEGFIQRHKEDVIGVLNGFDRVRFRGTRRLLANEGGMKSFLFQMNVLLKDFKAYVVHVTQQIREAVTAAAEAAGAPMRYLYSSSDRKEEVARQIAVDKGVTQGLICVLSAVEPAMTYSVARNAKTRHLELHLHPGKCLHYYYYYLHPELGFMHARLQTWFPFTVNVCINGREWLARQMDQAGIAYRRKENCFIEVADPARAQQLMDQQLRTDWPGMLNALIPQINPADEAIFASAPVPYYWSADETEWASDLMFRSPQALAGLYPHLVQYAMLCLHSRDVLRFLGHRVPARGGINPHFLGQVTTDLKERPEGVRIKHQVNRNSVKMYDKQGSVLRVETTVNDARDIKTYRAAEGKPNGLKTWRKMRKGVADLHRRAEVSQASNERYLESLAGVERSKPVSEVIEPLCRRVKYKGRPIRALNPLAPDDAAMLSAIAGGDFCIQGFRNRDLRAILFKPATNKQETRRQSASISRKLRLLRAHGLIQKVQGTHRYLLSSKGRSCVPLLLLARQADADKLQKAA